MESYRIEWKKSTKKDFRRISKNELIRIVRVTESLAYEPFPSGYVKLSGSEFTYRVRVGDYRIIYEVHDGNVVILIVKVAHRKDVYRSK